MNDETAMVKWQLIYPILKVRPMIGTRELLEALGGQVSKSYLNDILNVYVDKGLIRRIRGIIILNELFEQKKETSFGFWRCLWHLIKYRDERKQQRIQELDDKIKVLLKQMYGKASFPIDNFDSYEELEEWFLSIG